MSTCKYCGREFIGRGVSGHTTRCNSNPNRYHGNGLSGRKISDEHREKITLSMRNHFEKNPHMIPYRLYHSSKRSNPELLFEKKLLEAKIDFIAEFNHGIYTYDFAFPDIKLDLEIDGNTHELENVKRIDARRDAWAKDQGWFVYRIKASAIKQDIDAEFEKFVGALLHLCIQVRLEGE